MSKSIKEVFELYEQHIRNHSRLSKRPELSLDQALKELEAIMSEQVIGGTEQLHYIDQDKDPDNYIESERSARNELRYDQRQKLKEALYGKAGK